MGPPRGPPGPMGPRPLMEGVGDMGPVGILFYTEQAGSSDLFYYI